MKAFILCLYSIIVSSLCCQSYVGSQCIECPSGMYLSDNKCYDIAECIQYQDGFRCQDCIQESAIIQQNSNCQEIKEKDMKPISKYIELLEEEYRLYNVTNIIEYLRENYEGFEVKTIFIKKTESGTHRFAVIMETISQILMYTVQVIDPSIGPQVIEEWGIQKIGKQTISLNQFSGPIKIQVFELLTVLYGNPSNLTLISLLSEQISQTQIEYTLVIIDLQTINLFFEEIPIIFKLPQIIQIFCEPQPSPTSSPKPELTSIHLTKVFETQAIFEDPYYLYIKGCQFEGNWRLQNLYRGQNDTVIIYEANYTVESGNKNYLIDLTLVGDQKNNSQQPYFHSIVQSETEQIITIIEADEEKLEEFPQLNVNYNFLKIIKKQKLANYHLYMAQEYDIVQDGVKKKRTNFFFRNLDPEAYDQILIQRLDDSGLIPSLVIPRQTFQQIPLDNDNPRYGLFGFDQFIQSNQFPEVNVQTIKYQMSQRYPETIFRITYQTADGLIVKYKYSLETGQYWLVQEQPIVPKKKSTEDIIQQFQKRAIDFIKQKYGEQIGDNQLQLVEKTIGTVDENEQIEGTFRFNNIEVRLKYSNMDKSIIVDEELRNQNGISQDVISGFIEEELSQSIFDFNLTLTQFTKISEIDNLSTYKIVYRNQGLQQCFEEIQVKLNHTNSYFSLDIINSNLACLNQCQQGSQECQSTELNQRIINEITSIYYFIDPSSLLEVKKVGEGENSDIYNVSFWSNEPVDVFVFIVHVFNFSGSNIDVRQFVQQSVVNDTKKMTNAQKFAQEYPDIYDEFEKLIEFLNLELSLISALQANKTNEIIVSFSNGISLSLPKIWNPFQIKLASKFTQKQAHKLIDIEKLSQRLKSNFSIDIGPLETAKIEPISQYQLLDGHVTRKTIKLENQLEKSIPITIQYTYDQIKQKEGEGRQIRTVSIVRDKKMEKKVDENKYSEKADPNSYVIDQLSQILGSRFSILSCQQQKILVTTYYRIFVKDFKFGNLMIILKNDLFLGDKVIKIVYLDYFSQGKDLQSLGFQDQIYMSLESQSRDTVNDLMKTDLKINNLIFWRIQKSRYVPILEGYYLLDDSYVVYVKATNGQILDLETLDNEKQKIRQQMEKKYPSILQIKNQYEFKVAEKQLLSTYAHYLGTADVKKIQKFYDADQWNSVTYIALYSTKIGYMTAKLIYFYQTNQTRIASLNRVNDPQLVPYLAGCQEGQIGPQNTCLQCKENLIVGMDGECYPQIANCKIIEGGLCLMCGIGYKIKVSNQSLRECEYMI